MASASPPGASRPALDRPQAVQDYAALARQCLPEPVWQYLALGDDGSDQQALASCRIMPRPLRKLAGGHTRLTLLGQELEHPLLLAPVAFQRLFHRDGESASAMAAAAQGGQMLVSSLASQTLQAIGDSATQCGAQRLWFQLYWQGSRARTARLLQRALAAGYRAVVFTVDAPIKPASLQLPAGIGAVNLEADAGPGGAGDGVGDDVDDGVGDGAGRGARSGTHSAVFDGWMAQAPDWDDLAWLRQQLELPLLVKGLLHPDDAEAAIGAGCDGIIVSNHGGRVLPGAPLAIHVLPAMVQQAGGRVPVLFDSGIRHGRDVFVALALGATAVLVGRPYVWALASHGAMGVAHVIRLLRDELEMTMALAGCARLEQIGADCLAIPVRAT
jgi:4-hydroxymandelate oxidase